MIAAAKLKTKRKTPPWKKAMTKVNNVPVTTLAVPRFAAVLAPQLARLKPLLRSDAVKIDTVRAQNKSMAA